MQNVHRLRDVSHRYTRGVLIEYIQVYRRNNGIPHGVLLIEESGVGSRLNVVPGAPFVDDKTYLVLRVVSVHNTGVADYHSLNAQSGTYRLIVLFFIEFGGAALVRPFAGWNSVVMQGHSIHIPRRYLLHQDLSPVVVICIGAACDLEKLISAVIAAVCSITAVKVGVVFRAHGASAAPALVSYAEVLQLPGLLPAVALAELRHRGNSVERHVLHPVGKRYRRASGIRRRSSRPASAAREALSV